MTEQLTRKVERGEVVKILREISVLLQVAGESAFKTRAYDVGADRVAGLTEDLETLVAEKRLREVPGIGAALAEKITELVTTGRLAYHEKLKAGQPPGILELLKVPDLGPKKAAQLWRELGVGDVDALEAACREGKLRPLKGFTAKTEEKILEGIAVYRRIKPESEGNRRRLGDVLARAQGLATFLLDLPSVERAAVAGSARRFCETVGDVDLIVASASADAVFEAFTKRPEVARVLARGDTKCSVRLSPDDLQVDVRVVPGDAYATALHHFTGSKAHHVRLRGLAQRRGLRLSEWGVFRDEERLPVTEEADIYRHLGLEWIPPELREDAGEIEAASEGRVPARLVALSDIQGSVHNHSTWSDGKNSLEEMAAAARRHGLSYLTVTEHSRTASYAGGLDVDDLERQWEEIDRLNEGFDDFVLLKGIEVDILEDGSLDLPDETLARLDVVIGSIHARHKMDGPRMTERVLRAFENPRFHILGHATGRLIHQRAAYELDLDRVLEKAASRGVVIEINGNPKRLDLKAEYARRALDAGVDLVASADAHSVRELDHLAYAVGTARRAWAPKERVLNTLPAPALVSHLQQMRR